MRQLHLFILVNLNKSILGSKRNRSRLSLSSNKDKSQDKIVIKSLVPIQKLLLSNRRLTTEEDARALFKDPSANTFDVRTDPPKSKRTIQLDLGRILHFASNQADPEDQSQNSGRVSSHNRMYL